MSFAVSQADTLDYALVRYGASKTLFRGPKLRLQSDYVVVLGGSEVFGRFVPHPFCAILNDTLDQPVVNMGYQNAGIDAFLYDPDVLAIAKGARLVILQVLGAANMSNRFYRVHPRRNDRFLGPSPTLKTVFREVDFTDFSFNRHMLSSLHMIAPDRFGLVRDELQQAWSARMKLLVQAIDAPVLLLWLDEPANPGLGGEPLFVGADMVQDIAERTRGLLKIDIARAGDDLDGMTFDPMQRTLAAQMLSVGAHEEIARRVLTELG